MSADVRAMLVEAAPLPTRPVDAGAIQRRGDRIRFVRRAMAVVVALPMLSVAAWAGGRVDFSRKPHQMASAPRPCDGSQAYVSVFLIDDATRKDVGILSEMIAGLPHVTAVAHVSHGEAFAEFKSIYRDQPEFWISLSHDALPASLLVEVDDLRRVAEVAKEIPRTPPVDDVRAPSDQLVAEEGYKSDEVCRRFRHFLRQDRDRALIFEVKKAAREQAKDVQRLSKKLRRAIIRGRKPDAERARVARRQQALLRAQARVLEEEVSLDLAPSPSV